VTVPYYCSECDWSFHNWEKKCPNCGKEDIVFWWEQFPDPDFQTYLDFGTGGESEKSKRR